MENAAEALKISFAVLVFVVAVALTFSIIGTTRKTADVVLYHSDKTNFYELDKGDTRIVGPAEIVTTLYRIAGESIVVTIKMPGDTNGVMISGKSEKEMDEILANANPTYGNLLDRINQNDLYIEEFSEVDYSGMYRRADDGTKITIADGGTAMYITYTAVVEGTDANGNKVYTAK